MQVPTQIEYMLKSLTDAGYEAYLVGGCVRDFLLHKEPSDYDVTTSALPEETIAVFEKDRVVPTGLKHGTVTVLHGGISAEITTYRTETTYSDSRHPDKVEFSKNVSDDLCRRDFTVNAMAMDIDKNIIDLYGGRADLENQLIRAVGVPRERFTEDALRILRAFRFAAKLGFEIEKETLLAAVMLASRLEFVSRERIFEEFCKLLCGVKASKILKIMYENGIFECMFDAPRINAKAIEDIEKLPCRADVRFAALFLHDERILEHVKSLKTSSAFLQCVKQISTCRLPKNHSAPELRRTVYKSGEAAIDRAIVEGDCSLAAKLKKLIERENCFKVQDLEIDGKDIMELLGKKGKEVGEVLNSLLFAVFDEKVANNRADLIEYLKKVDNIGKV